MIHCTSAYGAGKTDKSTLQQVNLPEVLQCYVVFECAHTSREYEF